MSNPYDIDDDLFGDPASAAALDLDELNGTLLLFRPTAIERAVSTVHGPKDAVVADVTMLDGDTAGSTLAGCFIWPAVLQAQLKPYVGTGRYCLGRLGQGVAKPGQNAPWKLADSTDVEKKLARRYLAEQPSF